MIVYMRVYMHMQVHVCYMHVQYMHKCVNIYIHRCIVRA